MSGFAHPLGLLALLGVPVVLALHKLRRRLRERRVAGLFLFAPEALSEDAGRTVSPLLRTASLYLELLGATLLALLLAGPRLGADGPPPHLVVVLDDSASMGAVSGTTSVAAEARRFLRARIESLPSDGRVTIVLSGRPPSTLAGPRAPLAAALLALDGWKPLRASHDPGLALDLAREFAGPVDEIVFATDEADPEVRAGVEVAAFGNASDNVAIASARRFEASDHETLAIDLVAYAHAPVSTRVLVTAGEEGAATEVSQRSVTVDPERTTRLSIDVPKSDLPLRVALAPDALAIDGEAVLLPERLRVVPYAVEMSEANAAALRLSRLPRAVPGLVRDDAKGAALVFSDAEGPARPGSTRVVVSAPGTERDDWLGPFLLDRAHGLLEGLTLEGVVWAAGRGAMRGRGLAFAGDQALLSEEVVDGATTLRMNFDPEKSTLAASADWPILLSNVVERTRASMPGPGAVNVRVGEAILYRAERARDPASATAILRLAAPSGAEQTAEGGGLVQFEPIEPGIHRLLAKGQGLLARYSVAFVDGRESDLRSRGTSRRPPKSAAGSAPATPAADEDGSAVAVRILAMLLLAIVAADVLVLSRGSGRRPAVA